ncbi:S9 family peptidase [Kutzneria kofuensis]|uniref:Dipeptidyl aminopeptidase/acylaminoacyl peptidase n=1 Tax=Kutzneria kofuensis TaxID=103725 RepID=A0A7W9NJB7_9PSEU|nr:S9 family peptidase [Kutzneria kofuensis]MBB5894474.1 dipeptidyl aminopeptidase/acylaminoacyl peptidase [Kutzneria kofuensis]
MTDFTDLDAVAKLPRIGSLALSPDGTRLVATVAELAPDGKSWQSALWEVDPAGSRPARRLTRAAKGESSPVFTPDGSVLFVTSRTDAESKPGDDKESSALWLLPPTGEARQVYAPRGGVSGVSVARETGTLVVTTAALHGVGVGDEDKERRKAREDAGVTAILHEAYPIRFWDHDLGPDKPRIVAAPAITGEERVTDVVELTRDVPHPVSGAAVSPDGQWVVYVVDEVLSAAYGERSFLRVVRSDGTGDRELAADRNLGDGPAHSYSHAVWLPDSSGIVAIRGTESTEQECPHYELVLITLADGAVRPLMPDFPNWGEEPVVSADGQAVYFLSNLSGRRPVWRLELASGEITRLTGEGHYSELCVAADGSALYALRDSVAHPPQPVRLDPVAAEQDPDFLPAPGVIESLPGTLTEVSTTVADGRTVRAWLALPDGASAGSPAPLLLWVHGGPMMSWNGWSWRWNPWLMVARGYAVLLPDPALSTGYGRDMIQAGWGSWGGAPYTDLMAITDVTVERPEIDEGRTAAMGGSFGGYMANWIATQTERFDAIVTHASLWNLDAFTGTTDASYYWMREMTDPLRSTERILANSPHLRVSDIRTPMLVIHGDKDYRVPIGEGIRLYFDLVRHGVPAKFLYYPTENHWILTPGNAKVWYETIFAFLAEHVLGEKWERPALV